MQALRKERRFSLLKHVLVDQPVNVGVGQAVQSVGNLAELQFEAVNGVFGLLVTAGLQPLGLLPAISLFIGLEPQTKKGVEE